MASPLICMVWSYHSAANALTIVVIGAVRKRSVIENQRVRWCGTPRVFPSGTIPRIFKHLGRKTKLFPSNRGAATPL